MLIGQSPGYSLYPEEIFAWASIHMYALLCTSDFS